MSNMLNEISKKDVKDPIFKSEALSYILKFKWDKYARRIFWRQALVWFLFMIIFTVDIIFIKPFRMETRRKGVNIASTVLFIVSICFLPRFIYSEFIQFKLLGS